MITKEQAREVIRQGGSVMHPNGKLMTREEHLKYFDGTAEEKSAEIGSLKARLKELEGENSQNKTEEKSADDKTPKESAKVEKTADADKKSAKDK